jgi:hypothetical protein
VRGVQSLVAEEAQLGSVDWTLEGSHDRTLGKHYSRVRSWWLGACSDGLKGPDPGACSVTFGRTRPIDKNALWMLTGLDRTPYAHEPGHLFVESGPNSMFHTTER